MLTFYFFSKKKIFLEKDKDKKSRKIEKFFMDFFVVFIILFYDLRFF
jgi:hypothetical protein